MSTQVRDWMGRSLYTVSADGTVESAERAMRLAHARHVPVVENGIPVGVLSLRDILAAQLPADQSVPATQRQHLCRIKARQIMRPVRTIDADEALEVAIGLLLRHHISCLVVVHRTEIVGILTTADLLRVAAQTLEQESAALGEPATVSRFMTPSPVTSVAPSDRLNLAKILMRFGAFRHLPVVENDHLIGIVSDRDVLAALDSNFSDRTPAERLVHDSQILIRQIMTAHPRTVTPETEAKLAAKLLLDKKIGALPVVRGTRLVGILTERDFLSYLAAVAGERQMITAPHGP